VRSSVPRLLFVEPVATGPMVGMTFLDGVRLARTLRPSALPGLAGVTSEWLDNLVRQPSPGGVPDLGGSDGADNGPALELARVIERFRAVAEDAADPYLLEEALAATATLPPLPPTVEHRDLAPWNMLVSQDSRLLVLDWESAVLGGLPGLDAWYSLTYLALGCAGIAEQQLAAAYPDLVDPQGTSGRIIHAAFTGYAARAGLPPSVLPALAMLTWMAHLPSEARRISQDDRGARPSGWQRAPASRARDRLRRGTFLPLWAHEARSLLGGH
jgi:aminoglycoside phosphotransferase (APT) family kinase protein